MKDTYTIKKAYHWLNKSDEVEIKSEHLHFAEMGDHSGCQVISNENKEEIQDLCIEIVSIIKKIDALQHIK